MPAPKLAPGQKDGRVRSGSKPKDNGQIQTESFSMRLTPEQKEQLMSLSGSEWIVEQILKASCDAT